MRKQIIKTEIVLCRISDKYFGDRESGATSEWAACRDRDRQSDSSDAASMAWQLSERGKRKMCRRRRSKRGKRLLEKL